MFIPKLVALTGSMLIVLAACAAPATAPTATPGATSTPLGTAAGTATAAPTTPATTQPAGATVNACDLLTLQDISAATGKQYIDARDDGFGQCLWNTTTEGANRGDLVVGAITPAELSFIKSSFGSGGTDATVSGHAAFWNPTEGLGSMWVDIGGGQLFVLSFPRSGDLDDSYAAIAQSLAETAVGNL